MKTQKSIILSITAQVQSAKKMNPIDKTNKFKLAPPFKEITYLNAKSILY